MFHRLVRYRLPASAAVFAASSGVVSAWSDSEAANSTLLAGLKEHVRPLLELNGFIEREVVPILRQGDAAAGKALAITGVGVPRKHSSY